METIHIFTYIIDGTTVENEEKKFFIFFFTRENKYMSVNTNTVAQICSYIQILMCLCH